MMEVYADTSVLAKLYVAEPNSPDAVVLVKKHSPPLPVIWLHELELRNALRLKVFRGEITEAELKVSLADYQQDVLGGSLQHAKTDWHEVVHAAEGLSAKWTARIGCRSLDALHVGAAIVLKCRNFLTFDTRQAELARKAGLKVEPS